MGLPQAQTAGTPVISFAFNEIQFIWPFLRDFRFCRHLKLLSAKVEFLTYTIAGLVNSFKLDAMERTSN
jgi:hypothetical protein